MKIATSRFGNMEAPENLVIQVPEGILGFPNDRRYVVLDHDAEGTPFKWLQSVDTPDLAFIVIDPRLLSKTYRLEFDEETIASLGGSLSPEDVIPMSIINVPHANPIGMTVNLKAPILVHEGRRLGRQVILSPEEYSIAQRIFDDNGAQNHLQSRETQTAKSA